MPDLLPGATLFDFWANKNVIQVWSSSGQLNLSHSSLISDNFQSKTIIEIISKLKTERQANQSVESILD